MEQIESRYYYPEISELYIGYECEACFTSYGGYVIFNENGTVTNHEPEDKEAAKNWSNYSIEEQKGNPLMDNIQRSMDTAVMILKDNRLRTKYLDRSDIESVGWKHYEKGITHTSKTDWDIYYKENQDGYIKLMTGSKDGKPIYQNMWIGYSKYLNDLDMDSNCSVVYDGDCKSINELRKLMKWLNISK